MKVIFLDIDGVLNSRQSTTFWHNRRDQEQWENNMYQSWKGTLREYIAMEFCPIALSNLEELIRRVPDVKVVVSSTWRMGETVESLKKIFSPSKLVSDAIIDSTPVFRDGPRGNEIQDWIDKHPDITHYVILDDSSDMLDSQKENFVHTSSLHGFIYGDMISAARILGHDFLKGKK